MKNVLKIGLNKKGDELAGIKTRQFKKLLVNFQKNFQPEAN